MTAHIIHQKPSALKRLLNTLGLIDLHTKVNCWFCNQDSYILPGTRNTVDYWHCYLCDNVNQRDKNGVIMDPKLLEVEHSSNNIRRAASQPSQTQRAETEPFLPRSVSSSRGRTLCDQCQKTQLWIYDTLAAYIPDESDPLYQQRLDTADDEKRRLHDTHTLCRSCQLLIDSIVNEQLEALKFRNINRKLEGSKAAENQTKIPTKLKYYSEAVIWYLTHQFTILFILYCSILPPTDNMLANFNKDLVFRIYYQLRYIVIVEKNWTLFLEYLFTVIINTVKSYGDRASCLLRDENAADCTWSIDDYLFSILLFNLISLFSFDWHPKIKRWFTNAKMRNLSIYKKLQYILLFYRPFMVILVTNTKDARIIASFGVGYMTIAIISYGIVKLPEPILREQPNTIKTERGQQEQERIIEDVEMMDADDFSVSNQQAPPFSNSQPVPSYSNLQATSSDPFISGNTAEPMDIDMISHGLNNIRV